ncbi:ABC-type multidrug/protein/lipid transport system ATPase component [Haploplasma axanthum]|uniref:ABC-type multidrug/protein/lipid transport system ATPase component n=2 Tax=Haploplasma axanthum TaxID=29552 RepID=A0A449BEX5_HAPAX|nr:ABC-type multidrug/protein/lipid transport system ATPase component [Haploplasma axanthum]
MLRLLKYLKIEQWIMILASVGLIVLQVWLDLKLPEYMEQVTKQLQTPNPVLKEIWINGGYMLLCALGSLLAAFIVGFMMARIAATFSQTLRISMFKKIDSFTKNDINNFSTASLITRTTNDVSQVQMFITMGMQLLIKAPILAIWAITKITVKGTEWSIATGTVIGLLLILVLVVMFFVVPKFKKVQKMVDQLTVVTRENLQGVRVIRAYNAEEYQEEKFRKANDELTNINLFTSRSMSMLNPLINMLMSFLSLSIYVIGAYLIDKNHGNLLLQTELFGSMIVFIQYAMQVVMAFMMLVMIFIILPRTLVSGKRINEVLLTKPSIKDGAGVSDDNGVKGTVEFKNVSFKYPGAEEYVIKDVSFKVNQGETIAFIGSTGSGKSTLINLIPRFYDATEGEILIDDVDIKKYRLGELHDKIGYVPQKAVLFKGTIKFNVAYGESSYKDITDDDVWKALEIAQGKDFVEELPEKLDAPVAQGGTNLSGGQKQRLAIARAIAREPEILIFDDSFSALDYKTDRKLRTTLRKETKGVTSMIVAQRIGTIMDANKIVVLNEGKVAGIGTHHELLKTSSVYKEIALSQLSEEELAWKEIKRWKKKSQLILKIHG